MNNLALRVSSLLPKIRAGLVSALGRFPFMLLCGLAGTIAGIESLRHEADHHLVDLWGKVAMTAALGMPLFFALRMLRERTEGWRARPAELVGLPLLAAWFFMLPHQLSDGPGIVYIRWGLLLAAFHFSGSVAAYVRRESGNGFWQFNRYIFLRFCLATLYAGVLTGGLELALLSADKLFDLHLGHSYGYLFFIMAGCFHPVFFLAGVPRDFAAIEADVEYPRGLKAFTQFVLAPLVAAYTAILYAYGLKIVATHTWPHGWVALPVLILSGVGILSALLLHPLRTRPEEKWAGWFCRNFPRALAPLSLLLLLSVWQRIKDYGVTEERYLGIVAGGWILAWATIFIFKRAAGIRWVPASLGVICLLAAFGPWSAGAISKASQIRRLTQFLEAHGMIADGKIHVPEASTNLPTKEFDDLRSTIQYLVGVHGGEAIHGLFGGLLKDKDWNEWSRWSIAENILRKLRIGNEQGGESVRSWYNRDANGLTVEGFRRVSLIESLFNNAKWADAKRKAGTTLFIGIENGILKAAYSADGSPQEVPLGAFFHSLPDRSQGNAPPERLTVDWESNGRSFRIIFTEVTVRHTPDKPDEITDCSMLLMEK